MMACVEKTRSRSLHQVFIRWIACCRQRPFQVHGTCTCTSCMSIVHTLAFLRPRGPPVEQAPFLVLSASEPQIPWRVVGADLVGGPCEGLTSWDGGTLAFGSGSLAWLAVFHHRRAHPPHTTRPTWTHPSSHAQWRVAEGGEGEERGANVTRRRFELREKG